ncbi:hypothetical protein ACH3XW_11400 [Acanthocheilonema viteae]
MRSYVAIVNSKYTIGTISKYRHQNFNICNKTEYKIQIFTRLKRSQLDRSFFIPNFFDRNNFKRKKYQSL